MSECRFSIRCELTQAQLARVVDDIMEAIEYHAATGFITRVIVAGFDRAGKPIYETMEEENGKKMELGEGGSISSPQNWIAGTLL